MTNVDHAKRDAKFKAACEEYIREAMAATGRSRLGHRGKTELRNV
jgi:hypothetical protein